VFASSLFSCCSYNAAVPHAVLVPLRCNVQRTRKGDKQTSLLSVQLSSDRRTRANMNAMQTAAEATFCVQDVFLCNAQQGWPLSPSP